MKSYCSFSAFFGEYILSSWPSPFHTASQSGWAPRPVLLTCLRLPNLYLLFPYCFSFISHKFHNTNFCSISCYYPTSFTQGCQVWISNILYPGRRRYEQPHNVTVQMSAGVRGKTEANRRPQCQKDIWKSPRGLNLHMHDDIIISR